MLDVRFWKFENLHLIAAILSELSSNVSWAIGGGGRGIDDVVGAIAKLIYN